MLESRHLDNNSIYCLLLEKLTPKQQLNIKESIINANNRLNRVFPSLIPFSSKFLSGNRLINIYPSHFSFYSMDKHKKGRKVYNQKLNNLTFQVSNDSKTAIIISNTSIKNQVVTLIAYIYVHNNPIIKTFYHIVNIISTEAELFTIRYSIN